MRPFPWGCGAILVLGALFGCAEPTPDPIVVGNNAKQRGYSDLQRHDFLAAEADFREAAVNLPKDPYVQLNLGVVEQNIGNMDAARAAYRMAIELGKDVRPRDVTDPRYAGRTVAQLAEDDLAGMDLKDEPRK